MFCKPANSGSHGEEWNESSQKIAASGDWTKDLLIIILMMYWLCVEISDVNKISYTTLHFGLSSFLELIEHDFIKVLKIPTNNHMLT